MRVHSGIVTHVELVILCSSLVGLLGVGIGISICSVLVKIKVEIKLLLVLLFLLHTAKEVGGVVLLLCWCCGGSSILEGVSV